MGMRIACKLKFSKSQPKEQKQLKKYISIYMGVFVGYSVCAKSFIY